jgi:aryl-alcohol dehydrogenase-like predicted oxidoreductase
VAERQHDPIIDFCTSQGVLFLPYGPLGADPMKHGAPLASTSGVLAEVAAKLRVSTPQLALAWLLHRSPNIIVIPGTTSKVHLEENVIASQIALDAESLSQLKQAATP